MTSSQIRQSFLDFFKSKEHSIVPSSSLMPDSPNLLFTNAGMNQFVPIFLGQTKCPYNPPRAADTQKCIRAGGKHNDLDDVGLDTYHHTFFEMLGNWSFGNYFKKEAIEWAWELVVGIWKFPPQRIYATVFCPHMDMAKWNEELANAVAFAKIRIAGGKAEYGQEVIGGAKGSNAINYSDDEAASFWAEYFLKAGIDPMVHIVPGNRKDNFWMMGETGPCGPCSELHVDLTPNGDTKGSLVNQGDARCIEIWNLVFIQFNANPDGTFSPLPAKHVDTGMGFERVTSIIQGTKNFSDFANAKISNYETDIFRPIFDKLEKMSGKKYSSTLPQFTGSATVPVAPVGVAPTGSVRTDETDSIVQKSSHAPETAARDAQQSDRDGRAPQTNVPQATYYKRRLPHFERPWAKYMVSFTTRERHQLSPQARDAVLKSLLFGHEKRRYQMYAACVMPDHVHFLFEPQIKEQDKEGKPIFWSLTELMHSIKSFTAHEINKLEKASGQVWENESFDRMIRGDADLEEKFHYICRNPWDSGVVPMTENYPWLWTPDSDAMGSATVPVASVSVALTESVRETGTSSSAQPASHAPEAVARDAQQSDRDGRAPHSAEQIALDIAFRVIADHIRTLSFAIADGIQPGNTDRNYVLRRILRRAVRYGRTLGFHEPFFYKLVDVLADTMGDVFPEIRARRNHVEEVIQREEEAFNKTLDRGIELFSGLAQFQLNENKQLRALLAANSSVAEKKALALQAILSIGGVILPAHRDFTMKALSETERNIVKLRNQVAHSEIALANAEELLPVLTKLGTEIVQRGPIVSGAAAFTLSDTYGFPLDLTELMAREQGMAVDVAGFNDLMEKQRKQSQDAHVTQVISLSEIESTTPTKFVGFDNLAVAAKVLEVVKVKEKNAVILDTSSAYAEMGGQLGDTGELTHGGQMWRVVNTQKTGNTWLHFIQEMGSATVPVASVGVAPTDSADETHPSEKNISQISKTVARDAQQSDRDGRAPQTTVALPVPGETVTLSVDRERRNAIQRHHTVTHLLHWALHEVVSKEASQKGSLVAPEKLTFDFNSAPLTPEQLSDIEKLVNERILENAGVSWTEVPHANVKSRKDVMQFFGDKYGDTVRVVQIGGRAGELNGYSMELCGGTHTRATGEIGLFRIVGESAIAAGVRRIEAVAGLEAFNLANQQLRLLRTVAGQLNSPIGELEKKIESLLAQQKEMEKQAKIAMQRNASNAASELLGEVQTVNGIPLITHNLGTADGDFLQAIADALKSRFKGVVVLGGGSNNAVTLIATVSSDFVAKVQAGKIIQTIAPIVGGKGGGKSDNARGGGKDAAKLDEALAKAADLLK